MDGIRRIEMADCTRVQFAEEGDETRRDSPFPVLYEFQVQEAAALNEGLLMEAVSSAQDTEGVTRSNVGGHHSESITIEDKTQSAAPTAIQGLYRAVRRAIGIIEKVSVSELVLSLSSRVREKYHPALVETAARDLIRKKSQAQREEATHSLEMHSVLEVTGAQLIPDHGPVAPSVAAADSHGNGHHRNSDSVLVSNRDSVTSELEAKLLAGSLCDDNPAKSKRPRLMSPRESLGDIVDKGQSVSENMALEMWLNLSEEGHYHTLHHHSGAEHSGVYWVQCPQDPPSPCEHSGALLIQLMKDVVSDTSSDAIRTTILYALIRPRPGTMLIFPGWLPHAVLPLAPGSDGPDKPKVRSRVSASFNLL